MFRLAAVILLSVSATVCAAAEEAQDYHISKDVAAAFYAGSSFAHGHRHGYERGFHDANMDYQLGRSAREFKSLGNVPRTAGYHPEFGSKDRFRRGYEFGYVAGYADGYAGREFRGIHDRNTPATGPLFDTGVADGYKSRLTAASASGACVDRPKPGYCDGFRAGMYLGEAFHTDSPAVQLAGATK